MEISLATLNQALDILGMLLAARGYRYEVVAGGGGGLLLSGYSMRSIKGLDLIALIDFNECISANPLPATLQESVVEVGEELKLGRGWLHSGSSALFEMGLPEGFKSRMQPRVYGGLTVYLAGRFDQICFNLYEAVGEGPLSKHYAYLKLLKPTQAELQEAGRWCSTHAASDEFTSTLQDALRAFG